MEDSKAKYKQRIIDIETHHLSMQKELQEKQAASEQALIAEHKNTVALLQEGHHTQVAALNLKVEELQLRIQQELDLKA